ncbi:DUF2491 family protein [Dyella thiooxydans]|uniref:DUF2491 family protein n=1 Tax=Dyella thiooxydans TaxID=445710 RepID=UPI0007C43C47|nr:DUF2491 family protein [Dyella thiooxydans]
MPAGHDGVSLFHRRPPSDPSAGQGLPGTARALLPLGLRIGGRVQFDRTLYRFAPQAMLAELPDGDQGIECYGHIELGDGYVMHRFYLEDDAYLQVMTVGDSIESMHAFTYYETVNPPNIESFQRLVTGGAHLGAQRINYAGHDWDRVTSADAGDQIPPMAFDEVLFREQPPRRSGDLTNYAVVYSRAVADLQRDELLVVNAEDSGPNQFCITYAVGIEIGQADLDIT